MPEAAGAEGGATTIRTLAEALLTAADGAALGYGEIVARIREAIPGSRPTPRSIAQYASRLRRAGVAVPLRRGAAS